jgi:superfamily II DNA or RNA helicase
VEIRKLTKEEEGEILKISPSEINKRKTFYQKLVVNYFIQNKRILANLFTRAGKSYLTLDAITRYRVKYQDKICIVAPSDDIIKAWKKLLSHIDNIEYYIINSYTIGDVKIDKKYGMFIVDEVHRVLGATSLWFSTAIPSTEFDYFLALSGTMGDDKIKLLESFGVNHCFQIPLKTGYKLEVIPEFITYNIPVDFTEDEKKLYTQVQNEYNNQMEYFSKFSEKSTAYFLGKIFDNKPFKYEGTIINRDQLLWLIEDKLQTTKGNIWTRAKLWKDASLKRTQLLHNAENKIKAVVDFCNNNKGQKLVFTFKTNIADKIVAQTKSAKAHHSKIKPDSLNQQNKQEFVDKLFENLIVCKSVDMGFTADLDYISSITFDSSIETSEQRAGRGMLKTNENPDKIVRIINFYVNDFEYQGKKFYSQDKVWIEKAQKKQSFVEWINNVDEIR